MSKNRGRKDTVVSGQLALLDTGLTEGSYDLGLGFKQLLSNELRNLDRWTIAAQLSKSTGVEISKDTLDKRLSADPSYQMYAIHLPPLSALMSNNLKPFQYLLQPLGSDVLNPEDRDLIELARIQEQLRILEAEKMRIITKRGLK